MHYKHTAFSIASWWLLMILTASLGACSEPGLESKNVQTRSGSIREHFKSLDTSIDFYGKVVDQHDQPVVGAEVEVNLSFFDPFAEFFVAVKPHNLKTGFDGRFELSSMRGSEVYVGTISAEGYEFRYEENRNNSFVYGLATGADMVLDGPSPVFIPDQNNPVIFRLRKKLQNSTFLFEKSSSGIQVLAKESGIAKGTDFIEGKWSRMNGQEPKDSLSEHCDLFFSAILDESTGEWQVILKPGGPGGGILGSDQLYYVAPDEGYRGEFSFIPVDHEIPDQKFIYIRSRTTAIFTRLEIFSVVVTDGFVRIRWRVATNPYGDRILDAVDFPPYSGDPEIKRIYALKARLKSEAQAELEEGRLPPRPKIMALIEAAKRGEE